MDELAALFKPVAATQKVEKGVDPKSVLCAFFKQGTCGKGDKCKFSHDLGIERKAEKKNIYADVREAEDTMENWDDAKLADVVEAKHGENERKMPKTDIICKNFIEALENNKYGWFWECPTGGDKCHYRHALPPGFVLKRDQKKDKKDEISIEELVERERAKLGYELPRINLSTFLEWKYRKIEEKKAKLADDIDKKRTDFKAGRNVGLSGREMFTFNPNLISEEDMEDGEATFDSRIREDGEEEDVQEINLENLAVEVDGSGTVVDRNGRQFQVSDAFASASALPPEDFDEDLFDDEEDLDELEKELDALRVE